MITVCIIIVVSVVVTFFVARVFSSIKERNRNGRE